MQRQVSVPLDSKRRSDDTGPAYRLAVHGSIRIFRADPQTDLGVPADGADRRGLSGSDNSPIIRLLNRPIEPTSGAIFLGSRSLARISNRECSGVRRRDTSMVFKSFALMPKLTAFENATFGLTVTGKPVAGRREKTMRETEQVRLAA